MKKLIVIAVGCAAIVASAAFAAETGSERSKPAAKPAEKPAEKAQPAPAPAPGADMPSLPKPGPEQAVLKMNEGLWDATVEMWTAPGTPPTSSRAIETNAMTAGGLWLVTDFKGDFMGQPFQGHGVSGYDQTKKKYVGTWVDSMSLGLTVSEGDWDAKTKTLTQWMEGPDMSGKTSKMKAVSEWKDEDTRVYTMYDEGKTDPSMRITYKRHK